MSTVPNKVDELRTDLINWGFDEGEVAQMTKAELKDNWIAKQNQEIDFSFDTSSAGSLEPAQSLAEALPAKYGQEGWHEYIMGLMEPDELVDGYPKCNGLRRVAPLVLGPVISSKATFINVGMTDPRHVTVNYEISFDWKLDIPVDYGNMGQLLTNDIRTFGGLADCVEGPTLYGIHPAATAETKAESRALRKALCLNIIAAEEMSSGQREDVRKKGTESISKPLLDVLKAKIKMLGLDPKEIANAVNGKDMESLTMEQGREALVKINEAQQRF